MLAWLISACAQPGAGSNAKLTAAKKPVATTAAVSGEAAAESDAAAPVPAVTPTLTWDDADELMGLGSEDIRAALGAPARIREEEPARIYQYVGGDCVLDLFLYQEAGTYRVTYAEARSVKAEQKPVEACLKTLPAPIVAASSLPST